MRSSRVFKTSTHNILYRNSTACIWISHFNNVAFCTIFYWCKLLRVEEIFYFYSSMDKKDGYRQQNVRQRQKLISFIDYNVWRMTNYSSILYYLRVIWRWIISWPWKLAYRSLKVIETDAIQKLGCGFLFAFHSNYMTVSAVILEIFSVKEYPDLENRVRVHSRSLEMAPFDRSCMSSYSPSIATMAISCIVCEI